MADREIRLRLVIDGREANASLAVTEDLIAEISQGITDAGVGGRGLGTNLSRSLERARDSIQGLRESFQMVQSFVQTPMRLFIDDEQARMSFKVMIGDAEKATEIFEGLKVLGASTPLEFPGIRSAATTLLQFGVGADDLAGIITMLGDVAGGNEQKLQSLALVFGQVKGLGKLMGQDLLQLINAGFNPLQVMSEKTGKSMGELRKEMEDGKITFEDMQQSFKDVTSEGGKFFGMMEQQSQTLGGKMSTFSDNVTELQIAIGGSIGAAFSPFLAHLSELITTFNELPTPVKTVATTLGTLTAALVVLRVTGISAAVKSILTVGPSLASTGVMATTAIPPITGVGTAFRAAGLAAKNFIAALGPIGWAIIGITALAEGYMLLKSSSDEVTEATEDGTAEIKKQQVEFNTLIKVLMDANSSTEVRTNAITELNSKYPEYLNKLDLEKASIQQIAAAQGEANKEFERNIALKVSDMRSTSRYEQIAQLEDKLVELNDEYQKALWEGRGNAVQVGDVITGSGDAANYLRQIQKTKNEIAEVTNEVVKIKQESAKMVTTVGNELKDPAAPDPKGSKPRSQEIANLEAAHKHAQELRKLSGESEGALLQNHILFLSGMYEVYKRNGEDTKKLDYEIAESKMQMFTIVSESMRDAGEKSLQNEFALQQARLQMVGAGQEALLNNEILFLERKIQQQRKSGKETIDLERDLVLKQLQLRGLVEQSDLEHQEQVEQATLATSELKERTAQDEEEAKYRAADQSLRNIASLFGKHTAAYKAMAISQAIIDTYRAATAALAPPPVGAGPLFGGILAATTVAAGLANVAAITSTQMPGYARGGVVVGEAGPEIIAPMQDYATGWSQIVNATVRATERVLTTGGGNSGRQEVVVKQRGKDLEGTYRIAKSERERLTW